MRRQRSNSSNFGHGGTYACRVCKRKTRATGRGDNDNVELCVECFELAEIENAFSDGQGSTYMLDQARGLIASCQRKGGKTKAADWNIPGLLGD